MAKNPVNTPVIMRCIDAKVSDLLDSTSPGDRLDTLARTQALLLYQIIRFFDGDIMARSSADATFADLESSVSAMSRHIYLACEAGIGGGNGPSNPDPPRQLGVDPLVFAIQPSRESWREWIFQESARRTLLIASFLIKTWKRLTGRPLPACRVDSLMVRQAWTLSAPLWRARDTHEFSLAWRGKNHYVTTRKTVMSTLVDAGRDDIEPFGKMLLTAVLGVDEAKAWLGRIGAVL